MGWLFLLGIAIMYVGDWIHSYFVFYVGAGLCAVITIVFFAPVIMPEQKSTPAVEDNPAPKIKKAGEDFIPLEFTKVKKINNHMQQVSWKGRSFVIWKTEGKEQPYYQEVNARTNQPIGQRVTSTDTKTLIDHLKGRFKEL